MRLLSSRLGVLVALPLLAGCAAKPGHVTGKVTYKGNPLPAGWVLFRPADPAQNTVSAEIKEDGSFEADLPAGEVAVAIDNRDWEPRTGGGVPAVPANIPLSGEAKSKLAAAAAPPRKDPQPRPGGTSSRYVPIPEKYYDVGASGLKFTVKGGPQTQNFELTD